MPRTPGVHLALFVDDTPIYATDRKESYVLRKLQRGLNAMEKWCENWNTIINEEKTRAVYFPQGLKPSRDLPHFERPGHHVCE
jgi:hypothetical protein